MKAGPVRIPYVSWRRGRPRFVPGRHLRMRGHKGQDLRHGADGAWFSEAEAREWSAVKARELRAEGAGRPRARQARGGVGFVYFLRCGDTLKVGYSNNPFHRAGGLLTGIAGNITMIVAVSGSPEDERRVHAALAERRRGRGEWFDMSPAAEVIITQSAAWGRVIVDRTTAALNVAGDAA